MNFDANYVSMIHEDPARVKIWMELVSDRYHLSSTAFQDLCADETELFLGEYNSTADYAEETLGNAYMDELHDLPDIIKNHISWAEIWDRELRYDYDYHETPDGTILIWAQR